MPTDSLVDRNNRYEILGLGLIGALVLALSVFWASLASFHPMALVLIGVEVAFLCFVVVAYTRSSIRLTSLKRAIFPIALIVGSLCYSIAFTPLTALDEDYHYVASYMWSNLFIEGSPSDTMRLEDVTVLTDPNMNFWFTKKSIDTTAREFSWSISTDELSDARFFSQRYARAASLKPNKQAADVRSPVSLTSNPIQLKLPSAIGIAIGRATGLGAIPTFYLGRCINAVVWSVLIILSVGLIPFGKKTIMCLSLLPISLELIGSYSYDGPIIAYSLLLTALILRAIKSQSTLSRWEGFTLLFTAMLLAPCKMVYFPIAALAVLVPRKRFTSLFTEFTFKFLMIALPIATIAATRMGSVNYVSGSQAVPVTNASGEETATAGASYTLSWLLHNPLSFFPMFVKTMQVHFLQLVSSFIGRTLGWGPHLYGPVWLMIVFWLLLLSSSIVSRDDNGLLKRHEAVAFLLVFFLIFFLIYVAMLLTWTAAGSETIEGVQGRYFTPIAALALIPFRSVMPKAKIDLAPLIVIAFIGLDLAYMIDVFALALGA